MDLAHFIESREDLARARVSGIAPSTIAGRSVTEISLSARNPRILGIIKINKEETQETAEAIPGLIWICP